MALKYKLKELELGDIKIDNGVKSVVTNVDPNTGAISWSIEYIPNLTKLVEDSMELANTAKGVYQKAKDDKKFLDIYEQSKRLRNIIRTHVRNNYPEDYKKSIDEEVVNESKGAANYFNDLKYEYQKAFRFLDVGEREEYKQLAKDFFSKLQVDDKVRAVGLEEGTDNEKEEGPKEEDQRYIDYLRRSGRDEYADKLVALNPTTLKEETFEDEIERLKDIMYVDADNPNQILVYPLDKPDARRPSQNYIVIKGNNVTAVQGYNSGPISDFAVEYGMSYEDSSYDMGKEHASGQASLLSSNVLKDAIEAIENSRDLEAKSQRDYYAKKPDTGRIGYGLSSQPRMNEKIADVDEMSMSGGAGAYQTPYAFRLPKKKKEDVKEDAKKSANIHKQGQHPGEDLGPGPKATEDGVKDNAYVKQFKYQLVPKNKNGTYVQKGSGLEVKKLF